MRINTYVYRAVITNENAEDGSGVSSTADDAKMQAASDDLTRAWKQEYLPEVQGFLDEFEKLDLTAYSNSDLVDVVDHALGWMERLWQLHMLTVLPAYAAVNEFTDAYHDLFGDGAALDAYSLLGGLPNKTVEAAQVLWDLSRDAAACPEVARLLRTVPPEDFRDSLDRTSAGRKFARALDDYLHTYGQRGDLCSLTAVSWIEDPTPVIRNLASYLEQPEAAAPAQAVERAARERDQAVGAAHERLTGYPRPVVSLFDKLLNAAQTGSALTEDHTFYIDYCGVYQIRRVFLEAGRRLSDLGVVREPSDVFLLGANDLRQALTASGRDTAVETVKSNREEMDHFAAVTPPPVLGDGEPPQLRGAFGRFHSKMFGGTAAGEDVESQAEPGVWRGSSGSSGTARGTARIVKTLAEAGRLVAGEVLVAPTTAPPWTPLFSVAAAVVTDTGGVLSHCAIVAREYGLPAVVGVAGATSTISDGQLVEVDGDSGVVRLLESP
ncbi:PEP-utilizing enzyme [Spelaeicoccus albus]|nr:PEP-utilizing enzyme [Spelaeicoccus albus]